MKYLRFFLFPFSCIYYLIITIRNYFYDKGWFKSISFSLPVITVGNLSVGGTGKTPQIEYLIRILQDSYKVAVLSRGYKRKTKGFLLLTDNHSAEDVGDEPLQYFKKFKKATIAVDENRVEGIKQLLEDKSPEVILLDDAYQHRKVQGSFSILLTKYNDLFVNDFLLPVGNLRESRRGAQRSDVIIVTKCPENLHYAERQEIKNKFLKYKKEVFFTTITYSETILGASEIDLKVLSKYDVLLITGIANPSPLLQFMDDKNVHYQHLKFTDHHHFSNSDLKTIKNNFDSIQSDKKIILTTEKDFVRLESTLNNIYYLPIRTVFLEDEQKIKFDNLIQSHIKKIK